MKFWGPRWDHRGVLSPRNCRSHHDRIPRFFLRSRNSGPHAFEWGYIAHHRCCNKTQLAQPTSRRNKFWAKTWARKKEFHVACVKNISSMGHRARKAGEMYFAAWKYQTTGTLLRGKQYTLTSAAKYHRCSSCRWSWFNEYQPVMPLHLVEVHTQGRSFLEGVCSCPGTRKISLREALE
jgi:hypothetical protein